jgi:2-polyprenyl-3-methyl-5-hydroxy-6-metoxy-1,4-benzoquinol methylase
VAKLNVYDCAYHWTLKGLERRKYIKKLDLIKRFLNDKDVLLDVGCGDGKLSYLMSFLTKKVYAIDNQKKPIDLAKQQTKKGNLHFFYSGVLPFKNESFDVVTAFDVIEHIPESKVNDFVQSLAQKVKKKGRVVISTPNKDKLMARILGSERYLADKHHREYNLKEMNELLKRQGLNTKFVAGTYLAVIPSAFEKYYELFPFSMIFNFFIFLGKMFPSLSETIVMVFEK